MRAWGNLSGVPRPSDRSWRRRAWALRLRPRAGGYLGDYSLAELPQRPSEIHAAERCVVYPNHPRVREGGRGVVESLLRTAEAADVIGEQQGKVEPGEHRADVGVVAGDRLPPGHHQIPWEALDHLLGEVLAHRATGRLRSRGERTPRGRCGSTRSS